MKERETVISEDVPVISYRNMQKRKFRLKKILPLMNKETLKCSLASIYLFLMFFEVHQSWRFIAPIEPIASSTVGAPCYRITYRTVRDRRTCCLGTDNKNVTQLWSQESKVVSVITSRQDCSWDCNTHVPKIPVIWNSPSLMPSKCSCLRGWSHTMRLGLLERGCGYQGHHPYISSFVSHPSPIIPTLLRQAPELPPYRC